MANKKLAGLLKEFGKLGKESKTVKKIKVK